MSIPQRKEHYGDRVTIKWHPFALRPQYDPSPFQFTGSYIENAWKLVSSLAEPENLSYTAWLHEEFPRWSKKKGDRQIILITTSPPPSR